MEPVFSKYAPGGAEAYDTMDDIDLGKNNTVEALYSLLSSTTRGAVGICIAGNSALCDADDGYWGRAIFFASTGEYFQVRVCPRGSARVPIKQHESRMIATRRTSINSIPVVSSVMLFQPRECSFVEGGTPVSCGSTIGCRGVHVLLPSLFNKHASTRDPYSGYASIDPEGFHSVRPSTLCIRTQLKPRHREDSGFSFSMSPGYSYLTMAAHMFGVDLPDPLVRSSDVVSDSEHSRQLIAKQRRICKSIGETNAGIAIASALTITDILSIEGLCGLICNSFFQGALPDRMHAPPGLPLLIMMSVHVACHPERFNLPSCTIQDTFVNKEIMCQFHSRWAKVTRGGYRAMDLAIKSGYDNALLNAANQDESVVQLDDNLKFWQRVGQRTIAKLVGDCSKNTEHAQVVPKHPWPFTKSDLVADPISEVKYACLNREGFAKPMKESPIDKILLSPISDSRATLARIMDNVELWLRKGTYGIHQISKQNVNRVVQLPSKECNCGQEKCDCITDDATDDDKDDLLDNRVCVEAVENASATITVAMLHGAYVIHQFDIRTYLVSDYLWNECADCGECVDVLQGTMFSSKTGQCRHCNRKRCFKCSLECTGGASNQSKHCLRCMPGAPSPQLKAFQSKRRGGRRAAAQNVAAKH